MVGKMIHGGEGEKCDKNDTNEEIIKFYPSISYKLSMDMGTISISTLLV
jgi:hypothetical protein